MTHFIDHLNTVKKQTFDMAVITNSKGQKVGKIIIRYTDSQIGYNNETGIIFQTRGDDPNHLDFSNTIKNGSYNVCNGVYELLTGIGAKLYGRNGVKFHGYMTKFSKPVPENGQNVDSMSQPTEFEYFKIGNRRFNILWV